MGTNAGDTGAGTNPFWFKAFAWWQTGRVLNQLLLFSLYWIKSIGRICKGFLWRLRFFHSFHFSAFCATRRQLRLPVNAETKSTENIIDRLIRGKMFRFPVRNSSEEGALNLNYLLRSVFIKWGDCLGWICTSISFCTVWAANPHFMGLL